MVSPGLTFHQATKERLYSRYYSKLSEATGSTRGLPFGIELSIAWLAMVLPHWFCILVVQVASR
jgi:hypothetical protein